MHRLKGRNLWIIAISSIVLGLLITIIAFAASGFNINRMGTSGEWEKRTWSMDVSSIDTININTSNVGVNVIPTTGTEITITYFENNNTTYTQRVSGTTMSLEKDRTGFQFNIGMTGLFDLANMLNTDITVEIPQDYLVNGTFTTSNASVAVKNLHFDILHVTTTNARVILNAVTSDNNITVQTSNGSMNVSDVSVQGELNLRTTNASVTLSDVWATGNIITKTSNGSVDLTNVHTEGNASITSTNARIEFNALTFGSATIQTSNGRISGVNLIDEDTYTINTRTSNGSTTIGDLRLEGGSNTFGSGSAILNVTTSNASIELSFR